MSTPQQLAIDEIKAALENATFAIDVEIDDTPSLKRSLEELGVKCALHIEGGGVGFTVDDRSLSLGGEPEVSVAIMRRIGSDPITGAVDKTKFDEAEAVRDQVVIVVRNAIKASVRFGLLDVDIPERYDFDRLIGDGRVYLASVVFSLWDTVTV